MNETEPRSAGANGRRCHARRVRREVESLVHGGVGRGGWGGAGRGGAGRGGARGARSRFGCRRAGSVQDLQEEQRRRCRPWHWPRAGQPGTVPTRPAGPGPGPGRYKTPWTWGLRHFCTSLMTTRYKSSRGLCIPTPTTNYHQEAAVAHLSDSSSTRHCLGGGLHPANGFLDSREFQTNLSIRKLLACVEGNFPKHQDFFPLK